MKQFLPAGQIVNTHGIRGEVRVMPWADSPEFLLDFDTVYIDEKPVKVTSARVQKTCVLMKFKGVDTVEDAALLREKTVHIDRDDAQLEEGAVFVDDLLNMEVYDQNGDKLGQIKDVLTMPKNDVYIVRGKREYMIPAVKEYVKNIDVEKNRMDVVTIEGMQTDAD